MRDVLIFIPTYNERQNVEAIYQRIKGLGLPADILFLDDHSPDGTGEAIDRLAAQDPSVHVIHRREKGGIGSAHLEGIRRAYEKGHKILVTMDCDFTHQPEDIARFMERADGCDVVVGSRYLDSRSLREWSFFRKLQTYGAHFLTKHLLGIPYDTSGAFRLYRLGRIPKELFEKATAKGYAFFFESLYLLWLNGFSIKEIPIVLPARACGQSKMKLKDAAAGLSRLLGTCFQSRFRRKRYLLARKS
ncbi:MAG: polyprenol monophosphomannose synthase [Candidatus Omnitrophica bacterium]|nr:polyprenol monophosphomannose synthase [Candidatus Omnitrophota bacterium]